MVSRDNRYQQLMTNNLVPSHDGLRKLGIGVISALLGTTLYWTGAGNNIAKADTTAAGNGISSNQVTSGSSLTGNQAVVLHQNGARQESPVRSVVTNSATPQVSAAVTEDHAGQGATVKGQQSAAPAVDNVHPSNSASSNTAQGSAVKENSTIPVDSGQGGLAAISNKQVNIAEPAQRSSVKQTARVVYLNADDGFKQLASSGNINGKAGTRINYDTTPTLNWLHQAGYQVMENDFDNAPQYFGFDSDEPQIYPITLQAIKSSAAGGVGSPSGSKVKHTANHSKASKGMGVTQTALPSNKAGLVFSKSADRQTSLPGKVNAMAFGLLGLATAVSVGVGTTAKRRLYNKRYEYY